MTWNDYVRHRDRALVFMGLETPATNLGFPFLPAPATPTSPGRAQRGRRRRYSARPAPAQQPGYGPLFERARQRLPGIPAHRPEPVRPKQLRPYSMFARRQLSPGEKAFRAESDRIQAETVHLRPLDPPDDCRPGMPGAIRPCPFASCRYNLLVSVNANGSLKVDHGHLDPWLLEETCAIDVIEKNREGVTQERTAQLTGVTEDRIRQVERGLMRRLKRLAKPLRTMITDEAWSPADASGRQTCVPCSGEGSIGPYGEEVPCVNCEGDGYRWPESRPDASLSPAPR